MYQVQCETLEWRTHKKLAQQNEEDVEVRAPRNWSEWVDAFTNLFSPVNRIVLLAVVRAVGSASTAEGVRAVRGAG